MVYNFNGKKLRIDDSELEKISKTLDLTKEEAIAVWLDDIDIWVIPSSKIVMRPENAPRRKPKDSIVSPEGVLYMGTQHQGGKGGDVPEGQIFVTNNHYDDLKQYKVSLDTLIEKIKEAK